MIKKTIFFICFYACILSSFSQTKAEVDEEIKMFLFTSVESDGYYASTMKFEKRINILKNHFDFMKYENTTKIGFFKPNNQDSIIGAYEIQLFKILDINSEKQSRYLLWYKDFYSEVWLRASGYVENDMNLLFKYLIKEKISKKNIKKMISEWNNSDKMFLELDLNCLFKDYLKGKTITECSKTVFYIKINDSGTYKRITKNERYSTFSRFPLYGRFR